MFVRDILNVTVKKLQTYCYFHQDQNASSSRKKKANSARWFCKNTNHLLHHKIWILEVLKEKRKQVSKPTTYVKSKTGK